MFLVLQPLDMAAFKGLGILCQVVRKYAKDKIKVFLRHQREGSHHDFRVGFSKGSTATQTVPIHTTRQGVLTHLQITSVLSGGASLSLSLSSISWVEQELQSEAKLYTR